MKYYCNPLPLEQYQCGRSCRSPDYAGKHFREMADPTVIRFEDRWYLFPSAGMLWYSDDMVNWTFRAIEPFDAGYAPTVVIKEKWLYMSASWDGSALWRARHPFGPWEKLGRPGHDADGNPTWLRDHKGQPVRWGDPCLFVDTDGVMYCYCNLASQAPPEERHPWKLISNEGMIFGVRLRDDDPTQFAEPPRQLIVYDPTYSWQRTGEYNQFAASPILEGACMTRINGRYYLQYSVNGTEYRNYAIGCAISEHPLGPFTQQRHNPILIHKGGLINGCGHHSIVEGPDRTLWCFYTCLLRVHANYERRIGMDQSGIDANGELFIAGPSEIPQHVPGFVRSPHEGNDTGLIPLSINSHVEASSWVEGRNPMYAVDNYIRTWWQAADATLPQWLAVDLLGEFTVHAARIIFADSGLDYSHGIEPAPYGYRLLGSLDGMRWDLLCDRSENHVEQHIVFDSWQQRMVRYIRLEILIVPPGMTTAVQDFTVFGEPQSVLTG